MNKFMNKLLLAFLLTIFSEKALASKTELKTPQIPESINKIITPEVYQVIRDYEKSEETGEIWKWTELEILLLDWVNYSIFSKNLTMLEDFFKIFKELNFIKLQKYIIGDLIQQLIFDGAISIPGKKQFLDIDQISPEIWAIIFNYEIDLGWWNIDKEIEVGVKYIKVNKKNRKGIVPEHEEQEINEMTKRIDKLKKLRESYKKYKEYKENYKNELLNKLKEKHLKIPGVANIVSSYHDLTFEEYLNIEKEGSFSSSSASSSSSLSESSMKSELPKSTKEAAIPKSS